METAQAFFSRRKEAHAGWRRHLHQRPEVAFQEHDTAEFLARHLHDMGLKVDTGIAGTGIVATLEGNAPGASVGLRADMDALPIREESALPYRSDSSSE